MSWNVLIGQKHDLEKTTLSNADVSLGKQQEAWGYKIFNHKL